MPCQRVSPQSALATKEYVMPPLIVVLDDDSTLRELYQEILTDAGYAVVTGLPCAPTCAALVGQPVAGVLLDTGLPPAARLDLCRCFKAATPPPAVILLTTAPQLSTQPLPPGVDLVLP